MQQNRKRQRRGGDPKKMGKKRVGPNYSAEQITSERKNKGKGRLNKERSFRHKDNKGRK